LFSLRNKDNLAPFIAHIKKGKEDKALYPAPGFGPWFGSNDILVRSNSNSAKTSYSELGCSYQLPPSYVQDSKEAFNLLAGEDTFLISEIEVFY
jgi:hypothetical protein